MTLIVLYITLLLSVIIQVNAIRCQCSTNRGPIPCYNNWCEVNKRDGKEGACAVIQSGNSRTFACVLVRKDSGDECKVDKIDGRMQVRCWCRSSDYCNVDLAERVEEDHEDNNYQIRAEEIATSSPRQLSAVIDPREDFVINAAYEDDLTGVNYDDGDFSLEEDFPHNVYPLPPSLPTTPKPSGGPTIPPWRREVPAASDHELPPLPLPSIPERPDRIPVRPQEQRNRWSERVPERIPERVGERAKGGSEQRRITPEEEEKMRRDEQEKYRREWERAMEEYRRRQNEKRDPWTAPTQSPIPPPPTSRKDSTTTTTTTTKKPEVRKEPERIPERPRYVESTTSTSKRTEKPTTSSTSTTTTTTTKTSSTSSSTTTTTTPRPPSTESLADAFARIKENQEIAKKSYQNHRNRYRVYDFFKTSSTTSTSSSTSTTITSSSTKEPTTIRRTTTALSTTTRKPIEILTTRRRTTTTEKTTTVRVEDDSSPVEEKDILEDISEEKIENISEENEEIEESEEKRPENIHHAGQENKPKVSNLPGLLFALLLIFIF